MTDPITQLREAGLLPKEVEERIKLLEFVMGAHDPHQRAYTDAEDELAALNALAAVAWEQRQENKRLGESWRKAGVALAAEKARADAEAERADRFSGMWEDEKARVKRAEELLRESCYEYDEWSGPERHKWCNAVSDFLARRITDLTP